MIRRNRRPDWRRIKTLRSYTIDEAANVLHVHRIEDTAMATPNCHFRDEDQACPNTMPRTSALSAPTSRT